MNIKQKWETPKGKALLKKLELQFGKYKKIILTTTGKSYKVPTRDILMFGLKGMDLFKYPLWNKTVVKCKYQEVVPHPTMKEQKLLKALNHAINIIEMYETDTKDLKGYLKDGYDIEGFCQGTIYKTAIKDIKKIAGIK